jgi:hypothetical protein
MDEISMFTALRPPPGPVEITGARDRLAAAITGAPARRVSRKARLTMTGGLVAAAAATAIVVPATLPHGGGGAFTGTAWAVDRKPDGTVTVTLGEEFHDPAGLERALRADGITAYVRVIPWVIRHEGHTRIITSVCSYHLAQNDRIPSRVVLSEHFPRGNALYRWSWTLQPSAMPPGSALLFFAGTYKGTVTEIGEPAVWRIRRLPACVPTHP